MQKARLLLWLAMSIAATTLIAVTAFAGSESFRCKTDEKKGYSKIEKDYVGVDQVCPAHDNNYSKKGS